MSDYRDWTGPESPWLREGYYISYIRGDTTYYEYIFARDLAHYQLTLDPIDPAKEYGPTVPEDLIMTLGYQEDKALNQIWQVIFGMSGQVYIYIELPTDIHRHGIPKKPKPSTVFRTVSHFEEYMSPYHQPSFLTEHIMMKPGFDRFNLSAYNPTDITIIPKLNIFIAKCQTERVGSETWGEISTPIIPGDPSRTEKLKNKWSDTLEKLYRHQIPCRPLTLMPVRAPEAEV